MKSKSWLILDDMTSDTSVWHLWWPRFTSLVRSHRAQASQNPLFSASGDSRQAGRGKYEIIFCQKWPNYSETDHQVLSGLKEGQTQVDCPAVGEEAFFSHPIDIHYTTRWDFKVWVVVSEMFLLSEVYKAGLNCGSKCTTKTLLEGNKVTILSWSIEKISWNK